MTEIERLEIQKKLDEVEKKLERLRKELLNYIPKDRLLSETEVEKIVYCETGWLRTAKCITQALLKAQQKKVK